MFLIKGKGLFLAALLIVSSSLQAETRYFIAVETVSSDTELDYDNGKEKYEHSGGRIKLGAEFIEGGIVGIEFLSGDEDDDIDPFGTPFELKTDTSIGVFAHMGRPFYFRVAYSVWDAEYTDLNSNLTDDEKVSTLEYGFGYQLWLGANLALYADYSIRHTEAKFPSQFVGQGFIEYDSELVSVGVSTTF
ncbi:MAG: hypothetical protein GY806_03400 [Gammaproteobacteria bacterium]|nr:hypothetical protein [Gammaproteobacteria bacterium]